MPHSRVVEHRASTLVVAAEHDRMVPPLLGHALARGILNARYDHIAAAAHGATIHRAQEINTLLVTHFTNAASQVGSKA